jgi:hypothetical protein
MLTAKKVSTFRRCNVPSSSGTALCSYLQFGTALHCRRLEPYICCNRIQEWKLCKIISRRAKYNSQNHSRITVRILTTIHEDLNLIKAFIYIYMCVCVCVCVCVFKSYLVPIILFYVSNILCPNLLKIVTLDFIISSFIRYLYWSAWGCPKYRQRHVARVERHILCHNKPVFFTK